MRNSASTDDHNYPTIFTIVKIVGLEGTLAQKTRERLEVVKIDREEFAHTGRQTIAYGVVIREKGGIDI